MAASVSYPNGETLTYSYQTATMPGDPYNRPFYRPTQITSNLGFFITLSYQGDTLGTGEWNSVQEAAIYSSSAPATPLGQLTYEMDGTITDLGGRVFECNGCLNSLGSGVEITSGTMQLPGEGSPFLQIAALPGSPPSLVVGSVKMDGVQWSYAYDNLRVDPVSHGHLYDQLTVTGPNGYNVAYDLVAAYDAFGSAKRNKITQITDSIGRVTAYDVDANYRVTRIVYPEGNEVRSSRRESASRAHSSTPARSGCQSSAYTITRLGCTRPPSAGSYRPIPSAMATG